MNASPSTHRSEAAHDALELLEGYEALRRRVLASTPSGEGVTSLAASVLIERGMHAWISTFAPGRAKAAARGATAPRVVEPAAALAPPVAWPSDLAAIVAGIVLTRLTSHPERSPHAH